MNYHRLDDLAHREIFRVLKPCGYYIFTVPHDRSLGETLTRVKIIDPSDASKDEHLLEPEYHGDTNSDDGVGVLAYRTYGRDLEDKLRNLGFDVDYSQESQENLGLLNAELYLCKKRKR